MDVESHETEEGIQLNIKTHSVSRADAVRLIKATRDYVELIRSVKDPKEKETRTLTRLTHINHGDFINFLQSCKTHAEHLGILCTDEDGNYVFLLCTDGTFSYDKKLIKKGSSNGFLEPVLDELRGTTDD